MNFSLYVWCHLNWCFNPVEQGEFNTMFTFDFSSCRVAGSTQQRGIAAPLTSTCFLNFWLWSQNFWLWSQISIHSLCLTFPPHFQSGLMAIGDESVSLLTPSLSVYCTASVYSPYTRWTYSQPHPMLSPGWWAMLWAIAHADLQGQTRGSPLPRARYQPQTCASKQNGLRGQILSSHRRLRPLH